MAAGEIPATVGAAPCCATFSREKQNPPDWPLKSEQSIFFHRLRRRVRAILRGQPEFPTKSAQRHAAAHLPPTICDHSDLVLFAVADQLSDKWMDRVFDAIAATYKLNWTVEETPAAEDAET